MSAPALREVGPGEGEDDEREDQQPEKQQQQVLEFASGGAAGVHDLEEAQRAHLHPRIALLEQEVQQYGNPQACEGRQQEGMSKQEGHAGCQ